MSDTAVTHAAIMERLEAVEKDVIEIKTAMADVTDITNDIRKIWNYLKYALPVIAASVITNGVAGSDWGEILRAVLQQ